MGLLRRAGTIGGFDRFDQLILSLLKVWFLSRDFRLPLTAATHHFGCYTWCPTRAWIAVMIAYTSFSQYTLIGNISLSITAMVRTSGAKGVRSSDCAKTVENITELPDYGPRYEWDEVKQSHIIGVFFYGFIITAFFSGLIAEWLGPYRTILYSHITMAICNALCVVAANTHFSLVMVNRFIIGCCSGVVVPTLQCMIARWAPPAERGKFVSALLGNNLGTCCMWFSVGAITEKFGWPWGFYGISIFVGIFCIIFGLVAADCPETHPWITEEEKQYILDAQQGTVNKKKVFPPYKAIFTSCPFWSLAILHYGNMWGLYLQITGAPKFLKQAIGFRVRHAGAVSSLPQAFRLIVGVCCGMLAHIIPGIAMASIGLAKCNGVIAVTLLTLSQAINGAAVLTNLANAQDLAPNFVGSVYGILTVLGGTPGFIAPAVTGYLTKQRSGTKEWAIVFLIGGILYSGTGIIYLFTGTTDLQPWNEKKDSD